MSSFSGSLQGVAAGLVWNNPAAFVDKGNHSGVNQMNGGLYQRHRPRKLKDVVGQDDAVSSVRAMMKGDTFPKALLFFGPPGCGKTTLARIVRNMLGCADGDFFEYNSASFRGIDSAREIDWRMRLRGVTGSKSGKRIWLLDEAHKWTADAQEAMLKPLEEAPPHVHFFLCTTDPNKLKAAVRSRCTPIGLKLVPVQVLEGLVTSVAKAEGVELPPDAAAKVAEAADGSPRTALTILEGVLHMTGDDLERAIVKCTPQAQAINLAQALIKPNPVWPEVAKILRDVDDDPESLRRMVLGYCQSILLSETPKPALQAKAAVIISFFQYPLYDSLKPGLCKMCWDVVHMRKS